MLVMASYGFPGVLFTLHYAKTNCVEIAANVPLRIISYLFSQMHGNCGGYRPSHGMI